MEQLVKKIKENIRLDQCQKGDKVYISRGKRGASEWFGGHIVLEKIKPIQNGMVQIKYLHRPPPHGKILKIDLGGESIVERTRDWVPSDGEDKGYYDPKIVTYEGIDYRITSPKELADLPARAERERLAREERIRKERYRFVEDPLGIRIDPDAWASIVVDFMGGLNRGTANVPQISSDDNMKRVTDSKNKPVPAE